MKSFILIALAMSLMSFDTSSLDVPSSDHMAFAGGAYLTIAGKFGGEITLDDLKSATEIVIMGCAEGAVVYQYDVEVRSHGKSARYAGTSNSLTKDICKAFAGLDAGDEIIFDRVKAKLSERDKFDVTAKKFIVI